MLTSNTNLEKLKTKVDNLNKDKIKAVPGNLSKLMMLPKSSV